MSSSCCEPNLDGGTVIDTTLIDPDIKNPEIIGGKLTDTVIGKDCSGNPLLAGTSTKIATCSDLSTKQDIIKDKNGNNISGDVSVALASDIESLLVQLKELSEKIDLKQDALKDSLGGTPSKDFVVASIKELTDLEGIITTINEAISNFTIGSDCNGNLLKADSLTKLASCDDLATKQDILKDSLGNNLAAGSSVVSTDEYEALKGIVDKLKETVDKALCDASDNKESSEIVSCAGTKVTDKTPVVLCEELQGQVTSIVNSMTTLVKPDVVEDITTIDTDGVLPTIVYGDPSVLLAKPKAFLKFDLGTRGVFFVPAYSDSEC